MYRSLTTISVTSLCMLIVSASQLSGKQQKKAVMEQKDSTVIYQNAPSCPTTQSNARIITQRDLPFIIEESGEYELGQNLTFREEGAAITFAFVQNAKLKFNNYSIKLTHQEATGISILDSSEITIEDDAITSSCESVQDATSVGIHIKNSRKVLLNNLYFASIGYGCIIENSQDVHVQGTGFFKALNAGALVRESTNVIFAHDTFSDNGIGIIFGSASHQNHDCQVLDCSFPNSTETTNLLAQQITGLTIDGSSFSSTGGTNETINLAQLGEFVHGNLCNNVTIRNSSFSNISPKNHTLEGLVLAQGSGFLIDSITVNIDNTAAQTTLAAVHIGTTNSAFSFSNGIIRNSMIQGAPQIGLYAGLDSTSIVLENSLITGALNSGISLSGVTFFTIKGNSVTNNANTGILLSTTSTSNALLENTVSGNLHGIQLGAGTSFNTVQNNIIFGNTTDGITDQGTNNKLWFNTAFNNNNQNYITPVSNPAVITDPGKPAVAGGNIKG